MHWDYRLGCFLNNFLRDHLISSHFLIVSSTNQPTQLQRPIKRILHRNLLVAAYSFFSKVIRSNWNRLIWSLAGYPEMDLIIRKINILHTSSDPDFFSRELYIGLAHAFECVWGINNIIELFMLIKGTCKFIELLRVVHYRVFYLILFKEIFGSCQLSFLYVAYIVQGHFLWWDNFSVATENR
jgi:hypothetical protein